MHSYLQEILAHKRNEVAALKQQVKEQPDRLLGEIVNGQQKRQSEKSFRRAIAGGSISIIAEIKRKSPSKQHLADIADPIKLAQQYIAGGAAAISVLTDSHGFNGSLKDLSGVAFALRHEKCPILRKDFIIDPIQIAESIVLGADAVLLIVSVLKEKTAQFLQHAQAMGIDTLVEVHDKKELQLAVKAGAEIIGINNRNLTTFEVDTTNASHLITQVPSGIVTVAESGINSVELAAQYAKQGFNALLVGEALVQSPNPKLTIKQFKGIR